jgi:hypothetical protein
MGEMIDIFCKDCNYREGFSLGVGMLYHSLENVLDEVPPANRKEIKSIIHNNEVLEEGGCHTLFRCIKCNALYERFHVRIVYKTHNGEERKYEIHHWCSKDHSELVPVNTSEEFDEEDYRGDHEILAPFIEQLPCPKCAKKSLVIQNSGFWD